ncbi:hypothetical protein S14_206 [Shewanella sp. phage 1/4]|uniref:hypothetical protein n=1 Tax=Shewanella phage 1/4 TaxID=1458859 RepID=UPI0004F8264D|nr:hypothetical protein S14_206 [Shewanella sp. phage 1/4]AHK11315.1 hypothetical protein S14_206 [Shewanella sp. phage 1/4]
MKQYIIMNKDENRLQIENNHNLFILSGQLGNEYVQDIKPVIYNSKWLAKWKSWQYGCIIVEVEMSDIAYDLPKSAYKWLMRKENKEVFKVWGDKIIDYPSTDYMEFNF